MLEEQVVSFKVAKLAEEKGFKDVVGKWRGKSYYNYKGELDGDVTDQLRPSNRNNPKFDSVAAPTQSLLQKYLRDKYNMHIRISICGLSADEGIAFISYSWSLFNTIDCVEYDKKGFDIAEPSYEKALDAALFEVLSLI